jgi:hypothetical protein
VKKYKKLKQHKRKKYGHNSFIEKEETKVMQARRLTGL